MYAIKFIMFRHHAICGGFCPLIDVIVLYYFTVQKLPYGVYSRGIPIWVFDIY